jgi:hypothetical protein
VIQSSQLNKGGTGTFKILNIEYWCDADRCLQVFSSGECLISVLKFFVYSCCYKPVIAFVVQQLLEQGTSVQLPNTAATLSDMKSLCLALLEALSDKVLALAHQKKANR